MLMNKARLRKIILPIHLVFVFFWILISLYLLGSTLFNQHVVAIKDLFLIALLPSAIGSMMTGMMMGFMLYHCPHNILWLRIKMICSILLMIVISLWLRVAAYGDDIANASYALATVLLLLCIALLISYRKPLGKKKKSKNLGNKIQG